MVRIKQLPPLIANQIAAGEVIERPASVVKELLENAQDAGATNINIELGFAGLNQIKISDDGQGICEDDLPLAVMQHATSKITCLDDLYSIQSMGFRGEALASISAVAKLTIISRPNSQPHAAQLTMQEDKIVVAPCARAVGTTVVVTDLFYNAPVRKNFLRGQRTELQYVEDTIKRFALAAPQIAINVKHNAKEILHIPASNCESTRLLRIKKIFGSKFLNGAIAVDFAHDTMQVYGLLGNPEYLRSQRDKQWIYLNKRMVRDKLLQHAIMQIYHEHLPLGRYPTCLLYLDMPPAEVDVNVHPTKHEVRFKKPREVHDFLISSLGTCIVSKKIDKITKNTQVNHPDIQPKPQISQPDIQVLSKNFLIFYQDAKPYILNFTKLYQKYSQHLLQNAEYPLAARPLLVPVKYVMPMAGYSYFEKLQKSLVEFGIAYDFVDKDTLLIRTIPQCLPQLDIKLLFTKIDFKKNTNKLELVNLLVECLIFDANSCTDHELQMLVAYLQHFNLFANYACQLTDSVCETIFIYANTNK